MQIGFAVDDRLKARIGLYRTAFGLTQNGAVRELLHRALDAADVPKCWPVITPEAEAEDGQ